MTVRIAAKSATICEKTFARPSLTSAAKGLQDAAKQAKMSANVIAIEAGQKPDREEGRYQ